MDIVHLPKLEYTPSAFTHRSNGLSFKIIFEGSDDDPANNYQLAMISSRDFVSPRHKHNFDQIRYAWKGDFNIGPGLTIHESEFCYHPEGVPYGPQKDDENERILFLFQFGGASGQGYTSETKRRAANVELEKTGEFEDGRYYPHSGGASVDGFQALWEHVNGGKKLQYPEPRYRTPILVTPDHFAWKKVDDEKLKPHLAFSRLLAVFSERQVAIQQLKLQPGGRLNVEPVAGVQLLIVRFGEATATGQPLERESCIRLRSGQGVESASGSDVELLHYIVPVFK